MNSPFYQIVKNASKEESNTFLKIASKNLNDIVYLDHIAEIQSSIKDYEGCINTLSKMLIFSGDEEVVCSIKSNMALIYNKMNEPKKSLECIDYVLERTDSIDLELEKGLCYYFMGDYENSEKIMRNLYKLNITEVFKNKIAYNLAIYELEKGDFKKGYYQYVEKGHRNNIWPTHQRAMIPVWKGEIEKGKTIFIHSEGGIGDEIIGFRFAKRIKELGMRPIWKTNNAHLKEVFNRNGIETVLDYSEFEAENVVQCMAMYLPVLLNVEKDSIWKDTYLTASPEYLKKWKEILPKEKKLAVRWQGNTSYEQDLHRSIPMEYMQDLQYDGTKINVQLENNVDWAFNPEINNIEDTLAILSLCEDGLVTSCTSVAHMAGALGIKTIVCPPIAYYYVWAKGYKWYGDNVEVIRQENWKDWDSVFQKVQERINGK